jgi:hypothetical protein
MKTSEHFALDEWLSEYPDDLTYHEILAIMRHPKNTWKAKHIYVWEVVEDCTLSQVAGFIEDTKTHFERVTE